MTDTAGTIRTRTHVWPTLKYTDAPAAIAFLVDVVGFVESARYGEGDRVDHAELRWPLGGGVMLGTAGGDGPIGDLPPDTGSVYVVTDDPDPIYDRVRTAGARVIREMHEEDYGSREFSIRDPAGVHWSFGTYPGHEG